MGVHETWNEHNSSCNLEWDAKKGRWKLSTEGLRLLEKERSELKVRLERLDATIAKESSS